ncbi:hypothetical protein [Bacillus sp. B1-b2]|uniref:hypothetical protein n=1 Tax=Bacillus sp. B1-b2 TaxID=2653201 RepID=UPI00186A38E0|nr:hypothetical protein [Bacillus sp. B1-b2]
MILTNKVEWKYSAFLFYLILAIIDRRVGKRRLIKMYETIDEEKDWVQDFYRLRCDAEGIKVDM